MSRLSACHVATVLVLTILAGLMFITPVYAAVRQEIEFMFCANVDEANVFNELINVFNKKQDRITVKANWTPGGWGDANSKVLVMIAAGKPPAVYRMGPYYDWFEKGMVVSLQPFIDRDKYDLNQFIPLMTKRLSYKGQLYAVSSGFQTRMLAYTLEPFDNAGLDYPKETWHWEKELLDAAKKLTFTKEGKSYYGIGFWPWLSEVEDIIWSFGGDVFSPDGKFCLDQPESLAALEFVSSLVNAYKVCPASGSLVDLFLNGRLAMWSTGCWDMNLLKQQCKYEWDIAPMPKGRVGRATWADVGYTYGILNPKQAEPAWEFLKFLMSPEAQRIICFKYGIGGVPTLKELTRELMRQPAPPRHWDALAINVQDGGRAANPYPGNTGGIIQKDWPNVWNGKIAPKAWVDSIKPAIEATLKGR